MIELVEDGIIAFVRKIARSSKSKTLSKKKKVIVLRDIIFVLVALVFMAIGGGLLWFSSIPIPDLASFDNRLLGQSSKIYDRTGTVLLYDLGQNIRRTVIPFDQISPNIKNATISIEDIDFYKHGGIKISSLLRALFADIWSQGFSQGGSTITQQVVKNSLLTREKTLTRKFKEIFLAVKLEKTLSKDEILNLYLNETPYGGTIYGVEEASQAYFGKSAHDLDIAESAYLASMPQSPTYFSPYGAHRADLDTRKDLVLQKMKDAGLITDDQYTKAKKEKITFNVQVTGGIKAPHFVMFIKDYLTEQYGEKILAEGGLKVTTTLNYELEQKAEAIVKKDAIENGKLYHATNAALVAIDPTTGQILTMVGSRDYFDKTVDGNYNVATAHRQPGSSFKPFVYAAAFNAGYRPETVLFDLPIQFSTNCAVDNYTSDNGCYSPGNYDGKFRGPISIRNALAQSINVPAVETLYLVGVSNAIDLATKMGITTLTDKSRYGLSLVLGGGEVTLLDMTSSYGDFATEGVRHEPTGILKIEDKSGATLEEYQDKSEEVLPKDTALLISSVLSDNDARTPIFGAHSSLYFPDRQIAAKTGTTNNYRDTWVIGYTPSIVVGAWAGNNDNTPIDRKVAGYIVAPMWHQFMNEILQTVPNEPFELPEQKDLSGLKPILRGDWQSSIHSILYFVNKNDPTGPAPTNPANDPQFYRWENAVSIWAAQNGAYSEGEQSVTPITSQPSAPAPSNLSVTIVSPENNAVITSGDRVTVQVRTLSNFPILKVDYYLNGVFIGSSSNMPFGFTFILDDSRAASGPNTLKVIATDQSGAQRDDSVTFVKQ